MINLRYHIVSIVAVFLALGIGLALGSTFVDSILVNELKDQVDEFEIEQQDALELRDTAIAQREETMLALATLESNAETAKKLHATELENLERTLIQENESLSEEAQKLAGENRDILEGVQRLMPVNRLMGTSWVVMAPIGIKRNVLNEVRELLMRSEGQYLGTFWVRPEMKINIENGEIALESLFPANVSPVDMRSLLVAQLAEEIFSSDLDGPARGNNGEDFIAELIEAGALRYDRYQGSSTSEETAALANRVLIVTDGLHNDLFDEFFVPLIEEITKRGGVGVGAVAQLDATNQQSDHAVDRIRNDSSLSIAWATFDSVDALLGREGLLVGLDSLPDVGHFGELPSAESRFPR